MDYLGLLVRSPATVATKYKVIWCRIPLFHVDTREIIDLVLFKRSSNYESSPYIITKRSITEIRYDCSTI